MVKKESPKMSRRGIRAVVWGSVSLWCLFSRIKILFQCKIGHFRRYSLLTKVTDDRCLGKNSAISNKYNILHKWIKISWKSSFRKTLYFFRDFRIRAICLDAFWLFTIWFITCRVFLVPCRKWFVNCTLQYTCKLDKSLFTGYQKHAAMYDWSPCTFRFITSLVAGVLLAVLKQDRGRVLHQNSFRVDRILIFFLSF